MTCARGIAGLAKAMFSWIGAVEQEVLLQHDADVAAQPRRIDLRNSTPSSRTWPSSGR